MLNCYVDLTTDKNKYEKASAIITIKKQAEIFAIKNMKK